MLLVEDYLAKIIIDNIIRKLKLTKSKLIHVMPVGSWHNVLKLQQDLIKNNVLGVEKKVVSILDGDIKSQCEKNKEYKDMPKHFLPIPSVEKYLKNVLIDCKNNDIYKKINDDLFQLTPLSDVINKYRNIEREDNDGKLFYSSLLSAMNERNINEQIFVQYIAEIIKDTIDFSSLNSFLKGI